VSGAAGVAVTGATGAGATFFAGFRARGLRLAGVLVAGVVTSDDDPSLGDAPASDPAPSFDALADAPFSLASRDDVTSVACEADEPGAPW
jgi:hypothetical protein